MFFWQFGRSSQILSHVYVQILYALNVYPQLNFEMGKFCFVGIQCDYKHVSAADVSSDKVKKRNGKHFMLQ